MEYQFGCFKARSNDVSFQRIVLEATERALCRVKETGS
jgi:hypothetical protein